MKHSANANTVNVRSSFVCFVEANVLMSTDDILACVAGNSEHMASVHHVVHSVNASAENEDPCC